MITVKSRWNYLFSCTKRIWIKMKTVSGEMSRINHTKSQNVGILNVRTKAFKEYMVFY
uniref:Uncharacterized protein n=1 Tax=Octopus bimaculoides TaxID=37653 RepID=A0A0L8H5F6_OCTBM